MVQWVVTYPIDVVKSRIQAGGDYISVLNANDQIRHMTPPLWRERDCLLIMCAHTRHPLTDLTRRHLPRSIANPLRQCQLC